MSSDEKTLALAAINAQQENMQLCFNNSEATKRLVHTESSTNRDTVLKRDEASSWYSIGRVVGKGTFGRVQLASHRLTNEKVAIKSYSREKGAHVCSPTAVSAHQKQNPQHKGCSDALEWRRVRQEVKLIAALHPHPGIARFIEAFETPTQIQLVMEFAGGGSLCDLLKKYPHQRLPETTARPIFADLCIAVVALHRQNIIDFGFSQRENPLLNESDSGLRTARGVKNFCGTPSYMAPEVVSCKNYNGKLADVWSLGIILYLLLCGKFPFQATNLHQLYQTIRTTQITFPADVSKDAQQLIRSILLVDPPKRLPLVSILAHPWIKNEHNQIKTKQCDPQLREHAFDIFLAWEEGIAIIYKELDRLYGVSSENLVVAWQKAQHNSIVALGRLCLVAAERQFLSALSLNHPPLSNQERSRPHQPTRKQQLEQLIGLVQQSLVQ